MYTNNLSGPPISEDLIILLVNKNRFIIHDTNKELIVKKENERTLQNNARR